MIGLELLQTGLFLGGLIFLAGCYGVLYGVAELARWPAIRRAAFACYGLQCILALAIAKLSPLTGSWKLVVIAGTAGFLVIPPVTWRLVERTHGGEGHPWSRT